MTNRAHQPGTLTSRARYVTVCHVLADEHQVPLDQLLTARPGRRFCERDATGRMRGSRNLRSLTYLLTNTIFNVPQAEIARSAGVNRKTVNWALRHLNERLDDTAMDALLARYQQLLVQKVVPS